MKELVILHNVSPEAIDYYRNNVNGNKNLSDDMIKRKLTRNLYAGRKVCNDEHGNSICHFGKLLIIYDKQKHHILEIQNYTPTDYFWKEVKTKKFYELNYILGIN